MLDKIYYGRGGVMGAFDYILCDIPLPTRNLKCKSFQTKSIHREQDTYRITISGDIVIKIAGRWSNAFHEDELRFYSWDVGSRWYEFVAKFEGGCLIEIRVDQCPVVELIVAERTGLVYRDGGKLWVRLPEKTESTFRAQRGIVHCVASLQSGQRRYYISPASVKAAKRLVREWGDEL